MDELLKFWDLIVKSNTFNFAILVMIFAIVTSKLNLGEKIENIKNEIVKSIENAKSEKERAAEFLSNTRKDVANVENEVQERLEKAAIHAKNTADTILEEACKKASRFEQGISRTIEAEEKTISAALSKQTARAAIELAKEHIIKTMDENPELHNKFISDSIDELDRIKF